MKYIDADKLIAEIERLSSSEHPIEYERVEKLAYNRALCEIKDATISLQQEQPIGVEYAIEIGKDVHTLRVGSRSDINRLIDQDKQKPAEGITHAEIEQAMDEVTKFKVFAADMAKRFNITKRRDIDWHNFCAGLLTYLKVNQPAEWSEEDDKMLTGIIERGSSQVPPFEPALREEQMEWLMNRLKSLRPQPHLNPSDEQPEVDIEKEIEERAECVSCCDFCPDSDYLERIDWCKEQFRHFYEIGLNARKEYDKGILAEVMQLAGFKPPYLDGNQYCTLFGIDLMRSFVGFGNTETESFVEALKDVKNFIEK